MDTLLLIDRLKDDLDTYRRLIESNQIDQADKVSKEVRVVVSILMDTDDSVILSKVVTILLMMAR